jgi:phosphohistidine swiveling domain-containing protein
LKKGSILGCLVTGTISVGTIFTGSIDLSLMASTVVKQTSESLKDKLRRNSILISARSTGKRPRAVGSHSEIPTAVGSGEAAQMISAGVGV